MYGIIDLGSNTIHLKIYKKDKKNLVELVDKKEFAKLASYVENKELTEEGIIKCIKILKKFKETLSLFGVKEYYVIATASLRNVNNKEIVLDRIKKEVELNIIVLSGEEEGLFDYYGVRLLEDVSNAMIVDIGGGSTEVVFVKDNKDTYKYSIPYGSLNSVLGKREKIINAKQISNVKKIIRKELISFNSIDFALEKVIGVGGTLRALRKVLNKDNNVIELKEISALIRLAKNDKKTYQSLLLSVIPERIFTFTPGIVIIKTIMKYYGVETISINEYGIREGYLDFVIRSKVSE